MMSLLSVFLVGCSSQQDQSAKPATKKQEISIGIASELSTADVTHAMDNTAVEVMSQVAEGLYYFDTKGEVQPALAQEVVKPSEDGLTYLFKLREEGKWSNGEPVTAKDFEYSWKRTVDPKLAAQQSYYFDGILNYQAIAAGEKDPSTLGVKALNDYELEITLERPMSYFPSMLAIPAFFPLNQGFVESQGESYGTSAETTLYNGPFVMTGWDGVNSEWRYEKNQQYWDQESVKLDIVNVQVLKETATAVNLFNDGQMDLVKISGEYVAQEAANPARYERHLPGTYYLTLNVENELLTNKQARKAIDLSIDSQQLADKVLNDGSSKALGFVPNGFVHKETGADFADEAGELKQVNQQKAKELWQEAKKSLGIERANLEILGSDTDNVKKISEYIQGALMDNLEGLTVTIASVPFQNRLEKSRSGDFDAVIGGWTPVYADPVDFLNLFVGTNANNHSRWDNEAYNRLVTTAGTTYATDYQKRWETLLEIDRLLAEEAPTVPLFQITDVFLINPELINTEMGPLGSPYYKGLALKN